MKILYYIPYLHTTGAEHWVYLGWKHAFEDLGHEFRELKAGEDWRETTRQFRPDVFLIPNLLFLPERKDELLWIRAQGTFIAMIISWPMRPEDIAVLREHDVADIYYGERESDTRNEEFRTVTTREYTLIPYAADRRLNFPTAPDPKWDYDIVYLGANLPMKRQMFAEILTPLRKRYRVGVFGPYWTWKDNALRIAQGLANRVRLTGLGSAFGKARIQVPPEEENALYSTAKICLNFHERDPDGTQNSHYVLNQRTFKIPACGGFEICDYVPALRKYFAEDEVVMAKEPEDWFRKVEFFLSHPQERKAIQTKGTARALRENTYHNRVEQVLQIFASRRKSALV